MAIFATSPKTRIIWKSAKGGPREIFQKSPKRSPRLKDSKALWRKWHYPLITMHLNCKDWRRLWRKRSLQKCPNGQVNAIFARSPKPAFPETLQTGDQRKFFKNRPKTSLCLKGPKALCRKWHYPLISMHSKCKDWKRVLGKNTSPKVPKWPSYGNFRNVTENPHYLKKCKGGTKGNFF